MLEEDVRASSGWSSGRSSGDVLQQSREELSRRAEAKAGKALVPGKPLRRSSAVGAACDAVRQYGAEVTTQVFGLKAEGSKLSRKARIKPFKTFSESCMITHDLSLKAFSLQPIYLRSYETEKQ